MTRGAAIACYSMFSIAPLLVVAVAIAGLAFGEEAVRSAVGEQLRALVGREGAEAVQAMVRGVGEGAARAPLASPRW
jgi:membrane protein